MDGIILSFQLFTRLPLKKEVEFSKKNLNTALMFLPVIGLIVGALTGLVVEFFITKSVFIAGAMGLLTYLILSGGLHLDGLSDMADGFLSNRDKKKILDIMKDSLIGAFGTLSLIIYSILKFSLYGSISENTVFIIALSSFLSRLSSLYVIKRGALARPGGFGATMKESLEISPRVFLPGLILLVFLYIDILVLVPLVGVFLVAELIIRISTKKIGGLTGDIYGSSIEINELVALLLLWGIKWM